MLHAVAVLNRNDNNTYYTFWQISGDTDVSCQPNKHKVAQLEIQMA